MITGNNISYAFDSITENEIKEVIRSGKDYVKFEMHITNIGGYATLEAVDYNEQERIEVEENGDIYCDLETLRRLWYESDSDNEFLREWL